MLIEKISIQKINSDEFYRYDFFDGSNLISSIKSIGLLQPILVEKSDKEYRVIDGFKRVAAARTLKLSDIESRVVNESDSIINFELALAERSATRTFNPIHVSIILDKLQNQFNCDESVIMKRFLPHLGFGRNPKILTLYANLHKLDVSWQQAVIDDQVPVDFATEMLSQPETIRTRFWELIKNLRLGKNKQREFWSLLLDVAKIEKSELIEFMNFDQLAEIEHDEKLAPSQKADRYKQLLWKKRYPIYSKMKQEFDEIIKAASLPKSMILRETPFFEDGRFHVSFSFKNENEFKHHVKTLDDLSPTVKKLKNYDRL